jgi:hypothetical protein
MAAYVAAIKKKAAPELPSLATRIEWFEDWEEKTREAREFSRRDRRYYDNDQWTAEEIAGLEARGQPVITKNRIARKINFILGEEIKKRVDPVARPRTPQHEDSARAMTDALRFVEEEQDFDAARSAVFKDMLIEGYGGALKSYDEESGKNVLTHVQWDRLFYDPHSRAHDFSDAKYVGLVLWMDIDDAIALYPDKREALEAALAKDIGSSVGVDETTEDVPRRWGDKRRNRVKLAEMFFRSGKDWYRACFTQTDDLDEVTQTDGVVRALISPQDEINKRSSKALWALSVNGVIAERDFITDPQKFQTELAKPDGFAEVEPGGLQEQRVQIRSSGEMAQGDLTLLQEAKAEIDTIGPSSSTLPDLPDSSSGRAFLARQQAASQELGTIFDTLRRWGKSIFELDWLCIRQHWTEEKWLRVTDDEELTGYRFVALNRQMTRAQRFSELLEKQVPPPSALQTAAGPVSAAIMRQVQMMAQQIGAQAQQMGQQAPPIEQLILQHPLMQEVITENQIDQIPVDVVLDEAPETAILAQEEFSTLTELLPTVVQARPDMAPEMVKLIVNASNLTNKRQLREALEKGPDPQQMQQQQQIQQLQMALEQAKAQLIQAQSQNQASQAQLNQAKAAQVSAETQTTAPLAQADIEAKKARALHDAASAGATAGDSVPAFVGG